MVGVVPVVVGVSVVVPGVGDVGTRDASRLRVVGERSSLFGEAGRRSDTRDHVGSRGDQAAETLLVAERVAAAIHGPSAPA